MKGRTCEILPTVTVVGLEPGSVEVLLGVVLVSRLPSSVCLCLSLSLSVSLCLSLSVSVHLCNVESQSSLTQKTFAVSLLLLLP